MKKKVLIIASLVMMSVFYSPMAWAYSFSKVMSSGDTLYFTIISTANNTVEAVHPSYSAVPNYNGYAKPTGALMIPQTVEYSGTTYTVVSIGTYAYYGCDGITSVSIPSTVTHIKQSAFSQCTSLTSATLVSGLEVIGAWAFANCSSLQTISIPSTVDSIATHAFEYSGLTSFTFPAGITNVSYNLFGHCESLANVTLPSTLTTISEYAFQYCVSLEHIDIPSTVTSIKDYTFYNCQTLDSVVLPGGLMQLGNSAFGNCYDLTSIVIPSGITTIPTYCFQYCSSLASVTFHGGITSIGNNAFAGCSTLNDVVLPNSIASIGDYAFSYCTNLSSLELPEGMTSLGQYAFQNTGLQTLIIPSSYTSLNSAFYGCHLRKVLFNAANMTEGSVYSGVFFGCSVDSLVIGANVNRIPSFSTTPSLKDVLFMGGNTKLSAGAFGSCDQLASVALPSFLDSIPDNAFSGTDSLLVISMPSTITYIGDNAFYMSGISDVVIPNGVLSIGNGTFRGCGSLVYIELPSSVTSIGSEAFAGIDTVAFLGTTPPSAPQTFFDSWYGGIINVPCGLGGSYRDAWSWAESYIRDTCELPSTLTVINNGGGDIWGYDDNYNGIDFDNDTTVITRSGTYHISFYSVTDPEFAQQNDLQLKVLTHLYIDSVDYIDGGYPSLYIDDYGYDGIFLVHSLTISLTSTHVIEAVFEEVEQYTLTVLPSDSTLGGVIGGGSYLPNSEATISALARGGSTFNGWSNGSMDNPLTVTLTSDTTLIAMFSPAGASTTDTVLVHDTTFITLTDTVTSIVYDTTVVYDTDTLWFTQTDTIYITVYDTIIVHDTVFVGVDDVETIAAKIYTSNGQVVVDGAEGNTVTLYDAVGRQLAVRRNEFGDIRFDIPVSGAYLVKVGSAPARRIVVVR